MMEMSRFLYEKSVSYKRHLIIPFVFGIADGNYIYSYKLLSDIGHKSEFHKADNPAGIFSGALNDIIQIAKEHLDQTVDVVDTVDNFKGRYTYRNSLIVISQVAGKYFYDHYPADKLNNIAAPKLFESEQDCINWVKQGIDRSYIKQLQQ
jgi:hypothetical protein